MSAAENQSGIEYVRDGAVLHLRFDRPAKKNAITGAMYTAMTAALHAAQNDPAVQVVLISGNGGCFTAGNDLKDFLTAPLSDANAPVVVFLKILASFEKIMVAAVRGPAIGIGTTLLLHCDMVLASETARFQLPFVDLALVPEAASSLLLPRLAGYQRAAELLLLGEAFDAARGYEIGLVNRVVADSELDAAALDVARRIAAKPRAAVLATKRLLKNPGQDVGARVMEEIEIFRVQLQSAELREAIASFFQPGT